jgi:hypothetical protein
VSCVTAKVPVEVSPAPFVAVTVSIPLATAEEPQL